VKTVTQSASAKTPGVAHGQDRLQRKATEGNRLGTSDAREAQATHAARQFSSCSERRARPLQAKLAIGASNDPLELEADQVADQVLAATPNRAVRNAPIQVQRHAGPVDAGSRSAPASVDRVLAGAGSALAPTVQQDMERHFGHDFSGVRVHTGEGAAQSAREVNAHAYTVGHNIVFGEGRFAPGAQEGRRLLAHELTHVVQQAGSTTCALRREVGDDDVATEEDGDADQATAQEPAAPPPPARPDVHELDYAFVFTGGPYGRAAEAFIRRYYPEHRLIRAASMEEMFDRLFTDTRQPRADERLHVRELIIVTHANAAGGMQIPLTRGDVARHRIFDPVFADDLQEEFQQGMHQRFQARRHTVVTTVMDDDTRVIVRGCEFGQADDALDVLRSMFGGQPSVWAPRAYQGYESIPIGSSFLRTPEEAFDFLVAQDFLPPEMRPAPDEDKRAYIARVFGLHGRIPAEFFVVGQPGHDALARMIGAGTGMSEGAEPLKVRDPVEVPSLGQYWNLSSPSILGSDAELDTLTLRDIADRAHQLNQPYVPQNACMLKRLEGAWERKISDLPYHLDYIMEPGSDPLAGMPGDSFGFMQFLQRHFRDSPALNPLNGMAPENFFGDSNLLAIDAARYPCDTPHEDTFQTRELHFELTGAADHGRAGQFDTPLAMAPPPAAATAPEAGTVAASDAERAAAERHRLAQDFSKSSGTQTPPSFDMLQRLSTEDLVEALGLALEIAQGGDRSYLEAVQHEMVRRQFIASTDGAPVVSMSEAEFEAMSGIPVDSIPVQTALTGAAGGAFIPEPLWYYRVLTPSDPTAAGIRAGADLVPRAPDPGHAFQPAASRSEMTFRHTRPGGSVPQTGTDRVSTARALEAFETLLRDRGTGEMVRIDVPTARRLGAQFLEHPEIQLDLDVMERTIQSELEQAREAGRGRTHIRRLESRLNALRAAREYTVAFQEGQGVGPVPAQAVTPLEGATLSEAVIAERAMLRNIRFMRWGGRVLVVVGAGLSVHRIATATPEQRARVTTQEAGGWAFSLGGAWAGTKAGAFIGGALGVESGPGLLITGAIGALVGGGIGFFVGEEVGDRIYDVFE
jgi:hypothetical protein